MDKFEYCSVVGGDYVVFFSAIQDHEAKAIKKKPLLGRLKGKPFVSVNGEGIARAFAELGNEGWEFVSPSETLGYIFKRRRAG